MTKLPTTAQVEAMTPAALVTLYNELAETPVRKFSSRAAGVKRTLEMIATYRAAQRPPTVASRCKELVLKGLSNSEIWEIVQPEFSMSDAKRSYPGWYRNSLKREGKI